MRAEQPGAVPGADKGVNDRARQVRLLAMDVDGVLTDGSVIYGAGGMEMEVKAFNVRDGLGIALARSAGLAVAWLTGRRSEAVDRRGSELRVDAVLQGVRNKGVTLCELAQRRGLGMSEVAFIGDDINDLPALRLVGLAVAPADAAAAAREAAHYVTAAPGGRGAVRETIELVLRAQGRLEIAQEAYLESLAAAARRMLSKQRGAGDVTATEEGAEDPGVG